MGALAPAWADTSVTGVAPAGPLTIDDILAAPPAAATPAPAAPAVIRPGLASKVRRIAFLNLHTDERCSIIYQGGCGADAMADVNRVLRDFRTGEVHAMDPRLIDLLADLQMRLDTDQPFHVISGYRSPKTNAALHEKSAGVATRSLHMDGKAIDVRVPGRQLTAVRDTALAMQRGGVGYYAKSDFVHVDTGRVRRW